MKAKKHTQKRDRLLLELPPNTRTIWHSARVAALSRKASIGQFVMEALREKLEREEAA